MGPGAWLNAHMDAACRLYLLICYVVLLRCCSSLLLLCAAWGGHLELSALSSALKRQILVHAVGMDTIKLGKQNCRNCQGQYDSLGGCLQGGVQ